ncbi:MAG: MFS transporter [Clostridium sp.]
MNKINMNTKNNQLLFLLLGLIVTIFASSIKSVYQIYFVDLPSIYSLSRSQVSLLGALFGLFVGVFSPFTGWLCDKYGPSLTIFSGVMIAVIGFFGIYIFDTLILLIFCFSILLSYALTAMTFIPFGVLIDKIFQNNEKNLTYTILSNGTAIGFIVLSPLWVYLNKYISWENINAIVSLLFLFILSPIGYYFWKKFPNTVKTKKIDLDEDVKHKIKNYIFEKKYALLALSFGGCGMTMAFIDVHLVALLKTVDIYHIFQSNNSFVAISLSTLGITELIGSFLVLWAINRYNLYLVLGFLYLVRAMVFLLMNLSSSDSLYMIFIAIFGLTYMGTVIISSLICLRWYGIEIKGRMFGILFLVHQIFVFISIWLGGLLYDFFASYESYVYSLIFMCLIAGFASFKLYAINDD